MSIINVSHIDGIPVHLRIVPSSGKKNVRTLQKLSHPWEIAFHNTANVSPTADDTNHAKFLENTEKADVTFISWHFTVDEDSITQHLPWDEVAYHAGTTYGNNHAIAIEVAENGDYKKAEMNALKLTRYLMGQTGIPKSKFYPHFHYSGKICPRRIITSKATAAVEWANFVKRLDPIAVVSPTAKPATTSTSSTAKGTVKVLVDSLNVRSKDNVSSSIVKVVKKGTELKYYSEGKWGYEVGNGQWVSKGSSYTKKIVTPVAPKPTVSTQIGVVTVLVDSLNVRSKDSVSSAIVKQNGVNKVLKKGTQWKCYEIGKWGYNVGGDQWISKGSSYTKFTKK